MGFLGAISFAGEIIRPYQAPPALSLGLWAAYIHTIRPPQQKPVTPRREVSPPFFSAHTSAASRSDITCVSGTFDTTVLMISWMFSIFDTSPCRAYISGATAR